VIVRARIGLSGLLLVAAGFAPAVAAPPSHLEEQEARLKALGVDASLKHRISAAIDRGTAWLAKVQRPSGSWEDRLYRDWTAWGATALCALAQRHAGTRDSVASARRAVGWLRANGAGPPLRARDGTSIPRPDDPLTQVYDAGLWAMLLAADGRPAAEVRGVADALASAIDPDTGWWGYATAPYPAVVPNLSTTQFAALGLRSAARAGATVDGRVWREHLGGLVRTQNADGSWGYAPRRGRRLAGPAGRPSPDSYATGTFMGAANLALAMAGADVTPTRPLDREVGPAKQRALEALRRDGTRFLRALGPSRPVFDFVKVEGFSYYALYALEKACIFHDLDRLGDVPWYAEGARHLLSIQDDRGSWSCRGDADALVSTAFALLFLLRASEVYHPTTPRDVATPGTAPTTTPSEPNAPPKR
jgi:hypothetical protein